MSPLRAIAPLLESPPAAPPAGSDAAAIATLLRSGRVRLAALPPAPSPTPALTPAPSRSPAPSGPRPFSCGLPVLDRALGGGFWRGAVHELVAPPSSGGTAMLRAALSLATRAGELCALIDLDDAFEPRGAQESGVDLKRLLWVAPRTLAQGLRAAELLLEAKVALVVLDLGVRGDRLEQARLQKLDSSNRARLSGQRTAPAPGASTGVIELVRFDQLPKRERLGDAPWARLARCAEKHQGALVVLSRTPQAGSFASSTIELSRAPARWSGQAGPRLLLGATSVGHLSRARGLPPSRDVPIALPFTEPAPWADDRA